MKKTFIKSLSFLALISCATASNQQNSDAKDYVYSNDVAYQQVSDTMNIYRQENPGASNGSQQAMFDQLAQHVYNQDHSGKK